MEYPDIIRKIPKNMILSSTSIDYGLGLEYYHLTAYFDLFKEGRFSEKSRRFVWKILCYHVAFGLQPLTNFIFNKAKMNDVNKDYDGYDGMRSLVAKIVDKEGFRFKNVHHGYHAAVRFIRDNNMLKIISIDRHMKNRSSLGVMNSRYVNNGRYVSLHNILMFGEFDFWKQLNKINEEDVNEINTLIRSHSNQGLEVHGEQQSCPPFRTDKSFNEIDKRAWYNLSDFNRQREEYYSW